jgi:hypothetical protein
MKKRRGMRFADPGTADAAKFELADIVPLVDSWQTE